MRYLSVCSGIEAASVAWGPLGWTPVAFAEIEPFPCAVLAHHYPDVPNLGDLTRWREWPIHVLLEADVLIGGTPCQSFSLAGLRGGLTDARGNLLFAFLELADAIDDLRRAAGRDPLWIVWENVPGVFSDRTNGFGALLGGLVGSASALAAPPGRSWPDAGVVSGPRRWAAWRVLDAQHFGLAQRRRRVFVLAGGGPGDWAGADALLPLLKGVRWHPAPSRGAGQVAPTVPSRGAASGGRFGSDFDLDGGLVPVAGTLAARPGRNDGRGAYVPDIVPQAMSAKWAKGSSGPAGDEVAHLVAHVPDVAPSLTSNYGKQPDSSDTSHGPMVVAQSVALRGRAGGATGELGDDVAFALRGSQGGGDKPHVLAHAFDARQSDVAQYGDQAGTLDTDGGSIGVQTGARVRRLTVVECARLQGFPDDYLTQVAYRGKPVADGPQYRALGNSMAVPVIRYLGERITSGSSRSRGSSTAMSDHGPMVQDSGASVLQT